VVDFNQLDGSDGFIVTDELSGGRTDIYSVGNINGDGLDELKFYSASGANLLWGRESGFESVTPFSTVQGEDIEFLLGLRNSELDFNADGLQDARIRKFLSRTEGSEAGIAFGLPGQVRPPDAVYGEDPSNSLFGRSQNL
jgi:hypothetical protein